MGIRSLVASARLVPLLAAGAAAQQVGGGVKEGVTFGDVPAISDAIEDPAAVSAWRVGHSV
jgi:hypothetical protein